LKPTSKTIFRHHSPVRRERRWKEGENGSLPDRFKNPAYHKRTADWDNEGQL